jgi:hypothetical protein
MAGPCAPIPTAAPFFVQLRRRFPMNYFKKGEVLPLLGKTPTKSRFYKQEFLFGKVVEDYADLLRSDFFIANFGRDDRFDLLKHCGCTSLARCRQSRLVSFFFHYFT